MPSYDFRSLSDKEFENLSRDLLQEELGQTFESFKTGKDGGIDFRCITEKSQNLIIQSKHWAETRYSTLLHYLQKTELEKIKKIKPDRYILTTSVGLTPANKDQLLKALSPFIKAPGDIYGRDDLNNLLGKFRHIEDNFPKLYLSSTAALRRIINNGVLGRSEFTNEEIRKNIQLYVQNDKYGKAKNILNKEHFLVVIGEPGIGKTALARMLIYELLNRNYQLVRINEKIQEAEDVWNSERKQVFYFDDFLGANYLEISQPKNSESSLVDFIKRVKPDPKKRIILTSRTTVLNQGMKRLEKLNEPEIELAKHEVHVQDYTEWHKARILYNHLYFCGNEPAYFEKIVEDKNYWKIIRHKNYTPRLIEFITNPLRFGVTRPQDYIKFVLDNLDDPSLIWKNHFEQQIDGYSQFLVESLFSIGSCNEETLKNIFEYRLNYEITNGGFTRKTNAFLTAIEELLGGFLKSEIRKEIRYYDFFNPSIVDFLLRYFEKNTEEKWRVLESAVYIEQFIRRFSASSTDYVKLTDIDLSRLIALVRKKEDSLQSSDGVAKSLALSDLYFQLFTDKKYGPDRLRVFKKVEWDAISPLHLPIAIKILHSVYVDNYGPIKECAIKSWNGIANGLFRSATEEDQLVEIRELFIDNFDQDFEAYSLTDYGSQIITETLGRFWKKKIDEIQWSGDELRDLYDPEEVSAVIHKIYEDAQKFNKKFNAPEIVELEELFEIDSHYIASENAERLYSQVDDLDPYEDEHIEKMEQKIDDLFNR